MTISLVESMVSSSAAGKTLAMKIPDDVQDGDYLLLFVGAYSIFGMTTAPAGWVLLFTSNDTFGAAHIYGKAVNRDAGKTYSWVSNQAIDAYLAVLRGNAGAVRANVIGDKGVGLLLPSMTAPAITPTKAGALLFAGMFDSTLGLAMSWAGPSGMTKLLEYKGVYRPDMTLFMQQHVSAGTSTGSKTFTWSGLAATAVGVLLSVEEVPVPQGHLFYGTNF